MRRLLNDRTHYATAVGCTHDGRQQLKQIANLVGILYTNSIRSCLLASFFSHSETMAALSKHAILCIAAYALVRRRRRRRRNAQPQRVGRVWIKPHIGRHDEQGAYENLVEELRHDPAEFEKFHRVNPATFDFLLAKVDGVISRQNTTYRASISAAERLSIN